MDQWEREDTTTYKVVLNHEEQYSIWPADRENPSGWQDGGRVGTKDECLSYIDEVWTDMRPLSLRKKLEELRSMPVEPPGPSEDSDEPSLVERLSAGSHPVRLSLRPDESAESLRSALESRYVHVRFPETRGGTELGFELDESVSDVDATKRDTLHLEGELTLDYVRVRCIVDLDPESYSGHGRLQVVS